MTSSIRINHNGARRVLLGTAATIVALAFAANGVAAQETGVDPAAMEPPIVEIVDATQPTIEAVSDQDVLMSQLYTEYLREMATDWVTPEVRLVPAVDPNLLYSEYLREILADSVVEAAPAAPAVDPNLLYSEYLREIAADW